MPFGETFENAYDCTHCGLKGISALKHKTCPNCGASSPGPEHEYIADINHPITNYDDLALAKLAADWTCHFCGTRNRANVATCTQCGNTRAASDAQVRTIDYGTRPPTSAPVNYQSGQSSIHYEEPPASGFNFTQPPPAPNVNFGQEPPVTSSDFDPMSSGEMSDGSNESPAPVPVSPYTEYATKPRRFSLPRLEIPEIEWGSVARVLAVLAVIGIILFLVFQFFHTVEVGGRVTGFSWSRVVHIDRYQTNRHEGRHIPLGGRYVRDYQVIDHYNDNYETVYEHVSKTCYRNNGNGSSSSYDCGYTSSHQRLVSRDPVYATQYVYDIDEWTPFRNVPAGAADRNPYWPVYSLAFDGQQVIGGERVSQNEETYTVNFIDDESKETPKKTYSYNTSQAEWAQYGIEQTYTLKVNGFGSITNNPFQDYIASEATQTASAKK